MGYVYICINNTMYRNLQHHLFNTNYVYTYIYIYMCVCVSSFKHEVREELKLLLVNSLKVRPNFVKLIEILNRSPSDVLWARHIPTLRARRFGCIITSLNLFVIQRFPSRNRTKNTFIHFVLYWHTLCEYLHSGTLCSPVILHYIHIVF